MIPLCYICSVLLRMKHDGSGTAGPARWLGRMQAEETMPKRRLRACILGIVLMAGGGAAHGQGVRGCAVELIDAFREAHGIPGLAVAASLGGEPVLEVYRGNRVLDDTQVIDRQTLFQLSSTAKALTGVLVMRLVEKGELDLDAPVGRYLSGAPGSWDRITLRHLLQHTSGLAELSAIPGAFEGTLEPGSVLEGLFELPVRARPGVEHVYLNAGYFLVQQIVERVAEADFDVLMRREVYEPASMTDATYWGTSDQLPSQAAVGYYPDDDGTLEPREFVFPVYLYAAGGAAATSLDLQRFAVALMDGRLLEPESLEELWANVRLRNGGVVSYGLGWDTKTHARGQSSAGHEGGMLTTVRLYPDHDLAVSILTNGFVEPFNPDDFATGVAAVWAPEIGGLESPPCTLDELRQAEL